MQFRYLKASELTGFLQSDIYLNSKNIPITQQRALSQLKNPRAEKDDVVLIFATDNNMQIIGFIGALPDKFAHQPKLKIAWNSCWWADPNIGKGVALPLFLRFLKSWNNQVLFRDLTDKTEQILMRLNQFEKVKKLNGYRYFLRLNSYEILIRHNKKWKYISPVLKTVDTIANAVLQVKNKSFKNTNVKVVACNEIDNEVQDFITRYQKKELFKRSQTELNWIINNKWLVEKSFKKPEQFYYFSDENPNFKNQIFKLYDTNNSLTAVLFFTNNNGLVKIPYIYYNPSFLKEIIPFIFYYLRSEKATSLVLFNDDLNRMIQKNKNPFWYVKKINKDFVVSKKLLPFLPKEFDFQDGEGDFVFT